MPARQNDRYSVAKQTSDLRRVVADLIIVTIALALVLNLISDAIFVTIDELNLSLFWRLAAVLALVAITSGVLAWFWWRNNRLTTDEARIDLLIPYEVNRQDGLTVPALIPQAPYSVITDARQFFEYVHSKRDRQKLARTYQSWQAENSDLQFKDWMASQHHQLVDALLLRTLHFYNERALGELSRTTWQRLSLPGEKRELDAFPAQLRDNPFIRKRRGWKIIMPVDVKLEIDDSEEQCLWSLQHSKRGAVYIAIEKAMTVEQWQRRSKKILTLRIGLPDPPEDALYQALGSRIRAWAEVRGVLGPGQSEADCFCSWATQLLTILEQSLDWSYFDEERRPAQLLIRTNSNVEQLQEQVTQLQAKLDQQIGQDSE